MVDRAAIAALPTDELEKLDIRSASLTDEAVMFIGFQRTKQISKKAREAWGAGDTRPMANEVRARRAEIVGGAIHEVWREYMPVREYLSEQGLHPKQVADVGCGAGINNIFLAYDYSPCFTLIDIEQTEDQYHGWASSGAGYASLDSARAWLEENGVSGGSIETINPRKEHGRIEGISPDLATSLYSCGFHYPIDDYLAMFLNVVSSGGAVILDIRKHYWRRKPIALEQLCSAGNVTEIYHDVRSVRIAVRG